MALTIKTSHRRYPILDWSQLTAKEQKEHVYIKDGEGDFVRYKGLVYYLNDFMKCNDGWGDFKAWDGYESDSYLSGVLVRYCKDDQDYVNMGTYFF